jgi:hypothetical protein
MSREKSGFVLNRLSIFDGYNSGFAGLNLESVLCLPCSLGLSFGFLGFQALLELLTLNLLLNVKTWSFKFNNSVV